MATSSPKPENTLNTPVVEPAPDEAGNRHNPLNAFLTQTFTLRWETVVYIVILLLAIFTRFYLLGDRAMSHDESLHTRYSYNLYAEGSYQHTPLMHGPILFHATAFSYFLFGDDDFTSRIYPALLGVVMVMFPLLFRRWLGRWGTILTSIMLLVSPLLMYYNRYIRHDTPSIVAAMVMAYCIFMYINGPENQRRQGRWLYILSAALIWNLGSKETSFIYIAIFGVFLGIYFVIRLLQHSFQLPGKTIFYYLLLGILLGGVASLGLYITLEIVPFGTVTAAAQTNGWFGTTETRTFTLWILLTVVAIVAATIGTMLWAFRDSHARPRWQDLVLILSIALIISMALVVFEEISHVKAITTETAQPVVPGEEGTAAEAGSGINWWPMVGIWILAQAAIVFMIYMKNAGWWKVLKRFPEFDVLIVMGTLILPWATALIPYLMGGTSADHEVIAQSLPAFITDLIANITAQFSSLPAGLIILYFLAALPLFAIAIAAGLLWDWKRWLVCVAVFHSIFAFFATTMFTNISGLFSCMFYSLGYWLEQQGVRRGSQPQYYYLLIIMPIYEFLPIIGGVLAMLSGLTIFWRRRKTQYERELDASLSESEHPDQLVELPSLEEVVGTDTLGEDFDEETLDPIPVAITPPPVSQLILFGSIIVIALFTFILQLTTGTLPLEGLILRIVTILIGVLGVMNWWWSNKRAQAGESDLSDHRALMADRRIEVNKAVIGPDGYLDKIPFLLFVSWWAILNLVGYSLAGEKMPWLGTHLTVPLILLTGWYFGRIVERIDFRKFVARGWLYLILMPLLFVTLFQVFAPLVSGQMPGGLGQSQLAQLGQWFAVVAISAIVIIILYRIIQQTGWAHWRRMFSVAMFAFLAVLTFRFAWMASIINADYATEYLVYAHAAPAVKWVLDDIEELSLRTTDGLDLTFAYDNEVSWPYSWYFRHYGNAIYVGENPTIQRLNDAIAVVVGEANRAKVEPLLEENYYRYEHIRLWWPMQDYFNLTAERVASFFDTTPEAAKLRQGIFDIWWSRDYSTYGEAMSRNFDVTHWPVSDRMHFYVRKDIAAQIWPYGAGEGTVVGTLENQTVNQCVANWQDLSAITVFDTSQNPLSRPMGITVDEETNRVYVSEEFAHRIAIFDRDGNFITTWGQQGSGEAVGAFFNRPNGIDLAPNGNLVVADTWNYRVQSLTSDGELVARWGQAREDGFDVQTEPVDGFWGPRDVAVDSAGNVYVSDTGNKRIRVYNASGEYIRDIGYGGSGLGQLDEPSGLAIHPDGRLFVADTWNRRIAIFTTDGVTVNTFDVRGWYEELGNRPYLDVDPNRDLLYVTDPDGGRVLVYDLEGNCRGSFGQLNRETPAINQFNSLGDIAVDNEGFVYVVDSGAGRVLKFEPFEPPALPEGDDSAAGLETTEEVTAEVIPLDEVSSDDNNIIGLETTDEVTAEVAPLDEATVEIAPDEVSSDDNNIVELETTDEVTAEIVPPEGETTEESVSE